MNNILFTIDRNLQFSLLGHSKSKGVAWGNTDDGTIESAKSNREINNQWNLSIDGSDYANVSDNYN